MKRILILLLSVVHWSMASTPVVVKDLHSEWLTFQDGKYHRWNDLTNIHSHVVYFELKAEGFKGYILSIESSDQCNLFVNGNLILSGKRALFDIDSLSRLNTPQMFFSVYSAKGIHDLKTVIVSTLPVRTTAREEIEIRRPTFFRDYAIIVVTVLSLFLLALFRTNPQLTLDYFSFAKIFSVQERNENLLSSRITSSVNLLFYLFCALLTGFLLSAVFYFAGSFFEAAKFITIQSLSDAFLIWLKLSLFILLLLASKLVIVLLFSTLFNFSETVSFQFFNFLRFVLFTAVMMGVLSLLYFLFKGGQPIFYERLIVLALVLMSAGSVMVLIKLLARAPFSFFHLFSYLCASEIIPLVIIIKIFF